MVWGATKCRCGVTASYGFKAEGAPRLCFKHKEPGMMNYLHKTCAFDNCETRPSFGWPDAKPQFCSTHRQQGMINLNGKIRPASTAPMSEVLPEPEPVVDIDGIPKPHTNAHTRGRDKPTKSYALINSGKMDVVDEEGKPPQQKRGRGRPLGSTKRRMEQSLGESSAAPQTGAAKRLRAEAEAVEAKEDVRSVKEESIEANEAEAPPIPPAPRRGSNGYASALLFKNVLRPAPPPPPKVSPRTSEIPVEYCISI